MAYDFQGGLFSWDQWQRFIAYARSQLPLIEGRIQHLEQEQQRIGTFVMQFQNGTPTGYAASPESYIGKLVSAYKAVGGDLEYDLQLRAISDPVYVLPGDVATAAQSMSDGSVMGTKGTGASESLQLLTAARGWVDDTIRENREGLERKIRRAVDYSDQLADEIAYLRKVRAAATVEGSLEAVNTEVLELFNDPSFRPLYKDPPDPYGLFVRAPLGGQNPGPDSPEADGFFKSDKGLVSPGSKGK